MGHALARLQQLTTLNLLVFAAFVGVVMVHARHGAWALLGMALVLFGYAGVLALEFVLLRRAHGDDAAPRASAAQLARAWWGEVRRAPQVFCWQQPFRSQVHADFLPANAQGRVGVVLVHGFFCNRGFWNHWLPRLQAQGTPCVAISMEPVFGSIDNYRSLVEDAVRRMEACTGRAPVIVAHSMGGLATRRWYADQAEAGRVAHVITIGTPHAGTWPARWAFWDNGRQMQRASPWLAQLAGLEAQRDAAAANADLPADTTAIANEVATEVATEVVAAPTSRSARFTCFYSHCDNIVFPPSTATLAGARNVHLEAVAHVDMAHRAEPWAALQAVLQTPAA